MIFPIYTPGNRPCPVVVKIEIQLAIAGAEFELFEEERVIEEGKGVEDVEVELRWCTLAGKGKVQGGKEG